MQSVKSGKKIIVAGLGPGSECDITPAVVAALKEADVVVGYKYYFQFVTQYIGEGCECIDTGMKRESAIQAFDMAEQGKVVCVISSGDAAIYGMTLLSLRGDIIGRIVPLQMWVLDKKL